jgi:Tol biopolymer transport system component
MKLRSPVAVVLGLALLATAGFGGAGGPKTKLVSKSNGGAAANGTSNYGEVTANGRFVVFESDAANLPGSGFQVYRRDLREGKTKLVSKTNSGEPAEGSFNGAISPDGQLVAFESAAANLPGSGFQVYVRDLKQERTKLVSQTSGGEAGDDESEDAWISANGRWISFQSRAANLPGGLGGELAQVYVRDLQTGTTKLVSKTSGGDPGNDSSQDPSMSANGRWIVFESRATNFPGSIAPDDQVYVRDLRRGKTKLVSKTSAGDPANADSGDALVSANGRFVGFESAATNLPGAGVADGQAFLRNLRARKTTLVSRTTGGAPSSAGFSGDPYPSNDGRFIVFESQGPNLPGVAQDDVYLRDRGRGRTLLVSRANDGSPAADGTSFITRSRVLTADSRFVVFASNASNLPGTADQVYVRGPLG